MKICFLFNSITIFFWKRALFFLVQLSIGFGLHYHYVSKFILALVFLHLLTLPVVQPLLLSQKLKLIRCFRSLRFDK